MPVQDAYPPSLEMLPVAGPIQSAVHVPGSKSMTNRALVLAAMYGINDGRLIGALRSEDTEVMIDSLRRLGFLVETDWDNVQPGIRVSRQAGSAPIPAEGADLFVGNSGTSIRFLTAMLGLGRGRYRLDGVPRMRERPMEDLLVALRQLGVHASSERNNGCAPIVVEANGLEGGRVSTKADMSSQFLSALLMIAPLARNPVIIDVEGPLVSQPYVAMTIAMMERIGLTVARETERHYRLTPVRPLGPVSIGIEPDASAASYFFAAAAITGGQVAIAGLDAATLQGDFRFVDVLAEMGCRVEKRPGSTLVVGGPLHGIDVDMNDISDTVMTLAAVACFAQGPTTIRNVGHIRHKETDRLAALATELRRIGASVDELEDGLTITPAPLHGAEIETYDDHRMAMSLALIGLRVPGIVIKNPGCVAKTYPDFFRDLDQLRG
jgi:3-phosphoshikimate 1-carboxyvinyltransferase